MPFDQISPETAKSIEQLRLMFNRLFLPILRDSPTMRQAPDGGPTMSTDIHLYPTQQGSRMPQVSPEQLLQRRFRSYGADKGGPA